MAIKAIDREELHRLLGRGAQLVEVLPPNEYDDEHLPGAINIPLRELDDRAEDLLRRDRPIVVYCWDSA
jgi:phage shock protein E